MPSGSEESKLVRSAAAGDGQAFAELYELYESRIFNYLLRLLGDRHEAEDATQDAFIRVLSKLPDLNTDQLQFGPYLYTVARNTGYDVISGRKKMEPTGAIPEGAEAPFRGELSDLESDPERAALSGSQEAAVQAANGRLPERQREVLALRELEELSYDDIADVMDMKPNAVAQLISRARIGLRKEMKIGAASSVSFVTSDCERAHGELACRQDKQAGVDESWLGQHLSNCGNCQVASEEMAEAGVSYRAWAPIVPAAWVFREVMAKANETLGFDWSEIERAEGSGGSSGTHIRRGVMAAVGSVAVLALLAGFLISEANSPERKLVVDQPASKKLVDKKKDRAGKSDTSSTPNPPQADEPTVVSISSSPTATGSGTGRQTSQPNQTSPPRSDQRSPAPVADRPVAAPPVDTPDPVPADPAPVAEPEVKPEAPPVDTPCRPVAGAVLC